MSVSVKSVLKTAVLITIETLETLVKSALAPRNAHRYCGAVGLPPIDAPTEWSPTVEQLRRNMEASERPEQYAEVARQAVQFIDGLTEFVRSLSLARGQVEPTEVIARRLILPILLEITRRHHLGLYFAAALLMFVDQRLQDSYPQGLLLERWLQILGDLAREAGWGDSAEGGTDVDWAPITSDALAVLAVISDFVAPRRWKDGLQRWWYGFDHPPIPGFELQRDLAQRAFTLLFDFSKLEVKPEDYDRIDPEAVILEPEPFALTVVPVPKSKDPEGESRLAIQLHGQVEIDRNLGGGWRFRMVNAGDLGIVVSRSWSAPIGNIGFLLEIARKWDPNEPEDPEAHLTFRASRFSVGVRADMDDLAAWLRLEGGEIKTTGGHWLSDYIPELRLKIDATAELSVRDGARLVGGAGGDLLIPVNKRIPLFIGAVTVRSIRVQTKFGRADGKTAFRIEGTASLTLELFSILKVHTSGLGAAFQLGTTGGADGNVAGVAKTGWDAVIPESAGLEVKVWKIRGGGALLYDRAHDRVAGAVELGIGEKLTLKGLGLYQSPATGGVKSFLLVLSLETSRSGPGLTIQGGGVLYGSNRATSPEAFLAAIATGDLDALLFAEDIIGRAAQYIAILERLFPTRQDASVLGVMARFSALSGRLTLDLGVLFELQGSRLVRVYVVAQFVGLLTKPKPGQRPNPLTEAVRVLADGIAIWDFARDELDLRILLRNSRVWGGELTGGATIFHGSPQSDGSDHGTYISIGGFHPDYTPPGNRIFVPPRLQLTLSKGDHLKIEVRAYVAVTPCSFQIGIGGKLEAHLYGFGIRGEVDLDILFAFDGNFNFHVSASVELLLGGRSLLSVHFEGTLAGIKPTVLSGKVKIKFLFWTLSKSGSLTIQEGEPEPETADVAGALTAAIADTANWEMGGAVGLTLADRERPGVWLPIGGPLRLRQAVTPLNTPIERFGAARLPAPQSFRIESVKAGTVTLPTQPVTNEFALGLFLNLSDEEMLSSHGFESREAGVEVVRPLEAGPAVEATLNFEELMIDPLAPPPAGEIVPVSAVILTVVKAFEIKPPVTQRPVRVIRERFTVVDSELRPAAAQQTFFEARASMKPGLRMVPDAEVV